MRTQADSPTKTCTKDGCVRPLRARGLCASHYNQQHQPNRYTRVMMPCSGCGAVVVKEKRTRRYATVQCSQLCRHWIQWGAWSSAWPKPERKAPTPKSLPVLRAYQCAWCGTHETSTRNDAKFCSRECKKRHYKMRRRATEAGASGTYTWADIARLWVTFDKACAYCASPTPLTEIQAEHVVALSVGGANNTTNLLPSCGPCNADKRELMLNAWATDRARRGLLAVTTSWRDDDARYRHLTSVRGVTSTA